MRTIVIISILICFKINSLLSQELFIKKDASTFIKILCYSEMIKYSYLISEEDLQLGFIYYKHCIVLDTIEFQNESGAMMIKAHFDIFNTFEGNNIDTSNLNKFIRTQYFFGKESFIFPNLSKKEFFFIVYKNEVYLIKGFNVNQIGLLYNRMFYYNFTEIDDEINKVKTNIIFYKIGEHRLKRKIMVIVKENEFHK